MADGEFVVTAVEEQYYKVEDTRGWHPLFQVEEVKRSYILTQGPLPHTCDHFWQMVWEQNCKGILMLNKCIERGMNKCYPYWPQGQDEPEVMFGRYRIELISIEDYSFFRLSHLQLENVEIEDTDDYNSVEIQEVLLNMRKQRLGLIQTPDQLRFSYVAILQRIWKRMADADDEKRSQEEEEEDDLPGSESEEIEDED
uniref:protein-tyrosine-phosphatase n=1 Tax=Amphimedon queenslandica TaxID=400682 RepID=A0A1X7T8N4_AMPQE